MYVKSTTFITKITISQKPKTFKEINSLIQLITTYKYKSKKITVFSDKLFHGIEPMFVST